MKTIESDDASRDSSPAAGAQTEDSPHSPKKDAQNADSSNADADHEQEFLAQAAELEGEEPPVRGEEVDSSPTIEKSTEAEGEDAPVQDESGAEEPEAGAENDLSQKQQQQAAGEQAFKDRPEWQAAIKLVPPEKQKDMRQILRTVFERESQLTGKLEKTRPAVEIATRLHRAVGDDGVENAVALVELWQRGDERAEQMLTGLLTDLQTRRGARLGSPDLIKKAAGLKERLEGGLIDQAEHDESLELLKEVERNRAGMKQTAEQVKQTEQAATHARQEKLITDRTVAINAWESKKAKSDPDYARIQVDVINRAKLKVEEQTEKAGRLLNPSEMVAIMEESYAEARDYVKGFQPRRRPLTPVRGQDSSANSRRAPKSDEEAFLQKADELGA